MNGRGITIWADGKQYDGEYVDDKKQGYGVFTYENGRRFEGEWLNGK